MGEKPSSKPPAWPFENIYKGPKKEGEKMKSYAPSTGTMNMYDDQGNFLQVITTDGQRFVLQTEYMIMKKELRLALEKIEVLDGPYPDKSEKHDVSKDITDPNHKDYMG